MRHHLIVLICIVCTIVGFSAAHTPAYGKSTYLQEQAEPEVLEDTWTIDSVVDWQSGFVDNLLIANNAGGELRLDANQTAGSFITRPLSTTFAFNAMGAYWRADELIGTNLILEIRGRSTPPNQSLESYSEAENEPGWGDWHEMIAADARSQAADGAYAMPNVIAFPPNTSHLQFRARFSSTIPNASSTLNEISIVYLNTMQGPAGATASPIIFGDDTLTPRPMMISRPRWSASRLQSQPQRSDPVGVILYQINTTPETTEILPLLRAMATYQTDVLGWDDMSYHYLIDQAGILYEGRVGGPTSNISRLSGGDSAVHIALIGDMGNVPSEAAQATLNKVLSWLCQAYQIDPNGEHLARMNDNYSRRANIAAHSDFVRDAPDPAEALVGLLPELRTQADRSIIRSRWYLPEGNVAEYIQHLTFFNIGTQDADTQVQLIDSSNGTTYNHNMTVPANGHAKLVVNSVVSGTASLSAISQANEPVIVERNMQLPGDTNVNAGVPKLSRIWYFPEGSTDQTFYTYLILFNPHNVATEAIITYMKGDGTQAEQRVVIEAQKRRVITVNDILPGVGFGTRIIASRPIAAERTMRFGPNLSGMHMGPGITKLSRWWFFAEGTTDPPFSMRLLVLNPHSQASQATITFMTPDGTSLKRNYAIPPTTRLVVDVNEVVPPLGIATIVESDRPVAAERALYFDAQKLEEIATETNGITETEVITSTSTDPLLPSIVTPMAGTVSAGTTHPAYVWAFAYGTTMNAREYLLLGNPGRAQARIRIECVQDDGSRQMEQVVMPSESRYTFPVHDFYPDQETISCIVHSTQPVVAERSIYTNGNTNGGSTSSGIPLD